MNNQIPQFSQAVIEQLGYYVYFLRDPETRQIFYVGKGTGNRVFEHLFEALMNPKSTDKLDRIRAIRLKGQEVECIIHRHGLTEKEAFEVESALIDFIGLTDLTNAVSGHHAMERGQMSIKEVVALYDAPQVIIDQPSILIIVNQLYYRGMSEAELYEVTRRSWKIGPDRVKVKYAFAVYRGIIRQVYTVNKWIPSTDPQYPKRWEFEGSIAHDMQYLVGGSVEHYTGGARSPFKYLNR